MQTAATSGQDVVEPDGRHSVSVLERAERFGVDLSLLRSNLCLTPTERVIRLQQMLTSVRALQAEARAWRERDAS